LYDTSTLADERKLIYNLILVPKDRKKTREIINKTISIDEMKKKLEQNERYADKNRFVKSRS